MELLTKPAITTKSPCGRKYDGIKLHQSSWLLCFFLIMIASLFQSCAPKDKEMPEKSAEKIILETMPKLVLKQDEKLTYRLILSGDGEFLFFGSDKPSQTHPENIHNECFISFVKLDSGNTQMEMTAVIEDPIMEDYSETLIASLIIDHEGNVIEENTPGFRDIYYILFPVFLKNNDENTWVRTLEGADVKGNVNYKVKDDSEDKAYKNDSKEKKQTDLITVVSEFDISRSQNTGSFTITGTGNSIYSSQENRYKQGEAIFNIIVSKNAHNKQSVKLELSCHIKYYKEDYRKEN